MKVQRRGFLSSLAALSCVYGTSHAFGSPAISPNAILPTLPIIDTHQHLWDLTVVNPSWLKGAPAVLSQTMHLKEYRKATEGLSIRSVYMEVDVDDHELNIEADHVLKISAQRDPTIGAVLGARPNSPMFTSYVDRIAKNSDLKGFRRVLHSDKTPKGYCLQESFVQGIRELGKRNLMFDLCMRPTDLSDGLKLAKACPETRLMIDHCGNAHPESFRKGATISGELHSPDSWRKDIEELAKCSNVYCKISGVIARLPKGGDAQALAPIINHCLDAFGPDRVVFGSDWPVCLLGAPLLTWVSYLEQIIAHRPEGDRKKLWAGNAEKIYSLKNA